MNMIKRIHASVQARFIRPWQMQHYEKTSAGKTLAQYKGKYTGQRCFLVGNGPSLKAEDLTKLHEAWEITFAFNRVYNIFDQTPWKPTFYISQDEKMLAGCADTVSGLDLPVKFIPIQLNWWHGIHVDGVKYFNIIDQQVDDPQKYLFSDDIAHCIYNSSTGMYTAAQIAAYMGFSEIYLIGVDHHFRVSQNSKGEIVVDNTAKDYFSEKYNEDKSSLYIPNTEKSTLTYVAMKKHCDSRGIKVYNASRKTALQVFEKITLEEVLNRS